MGGAAPAALTCKIVRSLVAVWSKLLTSLPGSKLSTTVSRAVISLDAISRRVRVSAARRVVPRFAFRADRRPNVVPINNCCRFLITCYASAARKLRSPAKGLRCMGAEHAVWACRPPASPGERLATESGAGYASTRLHRGMS
jgi:hypothetical protein